MFIDDIQLKNAIRLLIGGYTYDGGDLEKAVDLLKEIRNDYKDAIKREMSKIKKVNKK